MGCRVVGNKGLGFRVSGLGRRVLEGWGSGFGL